MLWNGRLKAMGIWYAFMLAHSALGQPRDAQLPPDVKAVWDLSRAHRETTPTRDQICINGLWRWQPARDNAERVPSDNWGLFQSSGSMAHGRRWRTTALSQGRRRFNHVGTMVLRPDDVYE